MPRDLNFWTAVQELYATATFPRKVAWFLFALTCIHLAFLHPYLILVPGERAKVFSGLHCAVAVVAAWICCTRTRPSLKSPELIISLILAALVVISSACSLTPFSSSLRGGVVIASAFGGFWCARLLLDTRSAQVVFVWLSILLLVGIIGLYLARPDLWGSQNSLIDTNPHPVADRMMLLFFAPLTLILRGRKAEIIGSIAVLLLAYLVFYLSNLRSAMLIPLVLGVIAVLLGSIRLRYFLAVLIPVAVVLALFFHQLPSEKIGREYEPAYYRAENYPFSWHIAKKHPWLGIGLRAPREQFLEDYEVKYPYVTKEKFAESVRTIISSENIFLTFMAEVGLPFTILYVISVGYLLVRLVRRVTAHDRTSEIPPVALLMSVAAGLVHFQVLDGLLHPQISWFFHILLGLIPGWGGGKSSVETMDGAQIHPLGKN